MRIGGESFLKRLPVEAPVAQDELATEYPAPILPNSGRVASTMRIGGSLARFVAPRFSPEADVEADVLDPARSLRPGWVGFMSSKSTRPMESGLVVRIAED